MPEWIVHMYTGERFCEISKGVYEKVNSFIDIGPEHDINRIIINGHWNPEALIYLALFSYERWGYEGLKAMIHHHLLDYAETLASKGKYGFLVRNYGPNYAEMGVIRFCYKVLDYIENDFGKVLNLLRNGVSLYNIIQEVKRSWGTIQHPSDIIEILKREDCMEFLENVIKVVREMKECMEDCCLEVTWLIWWSRYRDSCSVCKCIVGSSETYMLIPKEYVEKDLAYKVHERCFEFLKSRASAMLKQGLTKKGIFRRLKLDAIPPSIVYEVLKVT
jgi:hypothetical protein